MCVTSSPLSAGIHRPGPQQQPPADNPEPDPGELNRPGKGLLVFLSVSTGLPTHADPEGIGSGFQQLRRGLPLSARLLPSYANVKKCSNEGRALMQLDFQQFLMKLEKLTDIRPIPDKEFVETYIKAYYLTENDMERWVKEHREYSSKQLTNLVTVCLGSHINKKARQKLLAAIDDIDRPKR
uniref:Syndetin C-terminal domain-containing protein n=1 Tax=Monodelphis domestica TaxID=13616 RepID=A0A5F8HBV8_MONDO